MTTKEKKKRIFQLSSDHAEELYKKHKVLQRKESIYTMRGSESVTHYVEHMKRTAFRIYVRDSWII